MHKINSCINSERRFWCWPVVVVICFVSLALFTTLCFNMWVGAIGGFIGFMLGSRLSRAFHKGDMQMWLYWNTRLYRGNLIESSRRRFL